MSEIKDESKAQDDINFTLEDVGKEPDRRPYIVTEKVGMPKAHCPTCTCDFSDQKPKEQGIFKNGHLYKPGDEIKLDEKTAENFLALGEIEESK